MIRFINIGDQIIDGENQFAFYDTVADAFCKFSGSQTWSSVDDFKTDFSGDDIDRFLRLIHHNWNIRSHGKESDWGDIKLIIAGRELDIEPIKYTDFDKDLLDLDSEISLLISESLRCTSNIIEINSWKIAKLEAKLIEAVNQENYIEANEIQIQINNLKK